jgi:CubicO group peptidase (beta-lactamase class C family)
MNLHCCRVVAFAAVACIASGAAGAETDGRWPTAGWQWVTPEAAGFDPAKLAEAVLRIREEVPHTHAVFLEMNGQAFLDAPFYPYDGRELHNLASVTKSVMTTLIAIAADQGKLDLGQPMLDFFADRTIAHLDERKRRITVRHLAGMVSGLDCVGEHDEPTLHQMNASSDWVQFTLDLPMAAEPGVVFSYCSPGMHLLSAILQAATGQTAFEYAKANLFGPLGIAEAAWPADPQGVTHGWGDLRLFPRDAAKIGYLWINGGRWEGRQIVSESWVEVSSSVQIETGDRWGDDYGYGWWIMSGDEVPGYAATGRGGQRIGVFLTLGIVAVTTGGGIEPGEVLERIATAMVSPGTALPENPEGRLALDAALAAVRKPPTPVAPAEPPPLAAMVSGRTYRFEPNPLGLASLTLEFDRAEAAGFAMTFSDGQPPREGEVGLDGVLRTFPGRDATTTGMRGGWTPEGEFRAEYDEIAMIDAFDLLLAFNDDRLVMTAKERTYEEGITLLGRAD